METAVDYYATLRVVPGAGHAAIRLAYVDLMRRYHPDVNSSGHAAVRATAINAAYACLRDPAHRADYDRQRAARHAERNAAIPQPAPPRHERSVWRTQHAYIVEEEREPRPGWWKPAGLGLASLLTIILFTITSATPPAAAVPRAVVVVRTPIDGHGAVKVALDHAPRGRQR